MNLSNMIEEGKLKRTFIIATLVSTLVGTVTASIGLHDKYQEKKEKIKQQNVDKTQDDDIKSIREKLTKLEAGKGKSDDKSSSRSSSSSRSRQRRRRRRDSFEDDDEFAYSARRSKAMIERMYEENVARLGPDYARGDLITENKLQAQIIQLQQTVISVLQDALNNGRELSRSDVQRLVAAQNAARNGSLDALEGQYVRMLENSRNPARRPWEQAPAEKQLLLLEDAYAPPKRQLTFPTREDPIPVEQDFRIQRARTMPAVTSKSLFCRYSDYLQESPRQPLSTAFDPDHSGRCPACDVVLPVDTRDIWILRKPAEGCSYEIGARFVVKCHTEDGRYTCVLCNRFRDVDCICKSVEALVKHMGSRHSPAELDSDEDLVPLPA